MFSSPLMDTSYTSPNDSYYGRSSDDIDAHKGGILFGNRRRSTVNRASSFMSSSNPNAGLSAPSADIFASPASNATASAVPAHMRESTPSGGKSVHWSPALIQDRNLSSPLVKSSSRFTDSAISNAPPLRSLREDFEPARKVARRSLSTTVTHQHNQSNSSIIMSPDSYMENPDSSNDNWVTVFGFPPDQVHVILQFFSRHGEIVQHQTPPKGNWVHIGYSTPIHARQALARNGNIIDGTIRIGVIPTPEKELPNANITSPVLPLNPSGFNRSSIVTEQVIHEEIEDDVAQDPSQSILLENSMNNSRMSMASRAGMRPLNSSFRRPEIQEEKQDTSFLGKLWTSVGF